MNHGVVTKIESKIRRVFFTVPVVVPVVGVLVPTYPLMGLGQLHRPMLIEVN